MEEVFGTYRSIDLSAAVGCTSSDSASELLVRLTGSTSPGLGARHLGEAVQWSGEAGLRPNCLPNGLG
jgi:hypothetical protein